MTMGSTSSGIPEIATVSQVAEFTQTSESTLHRWRSEGKGPKAIKLGHALRYRRQDVLEWLDSIAEAS